MDLILLLILLLVLFILVTSDDMMINLGLLIVTIMGGLYLYKTPIKSSKKDNFEIIKNDNIEDFGYEDESYVDYSWIKNEPVKIERHNKEDVRTHVDDFSHYNSHTSGSPIAFLDNAGDADEELVKRQIYSGSQLKRSRLNSMRNKIELARVLYEDEINESEKSQWNDFDQMNFFI